MRTLLILSAVVVLWPALISAVVKEDAATSSPVESITNDAEEYDNESARKIIGSRVVTSVSVVMNGKEPQFADAVGNYVPRPLVPPRVASPVSLLDPDRYEFYTFNDVGELVKRLMTMEEIQSIVANGDVENQNMLKTPTGINVDNESNIRDIVNNVQKVLHSEMANNNFTSNLMHNKLDTPDTSGSWSSILPAIFGNTGESITANKPPVTTGSTADTILMHSPSKKPISTKYPGTTLHLKTTLPPKTTISKLTKQKPKPSRPASSSTASRPTTLTTQKIKYPPTTQNNKNTVTPFNKLQFSQLQNLTFTLNPTKVATVEKPSSPFKTSVTPSKPATSSLRPSSISSAIPSSSLRPSSSPSLGPSPGPYGSPSSPANIARPASSSLKPSSSPSKPSTVFVQKLTSAITNKVTSAPSKQTATSAFTASTKKPVNKWSTTQSKYPTTALKTSPAGPVSSSVHTTRSPSTVETTTAKKVKTPIGQTVTPPQNTFATAIPAKKTTPKYKTTKITTHIASTQAYSPKISSTTANFPLSTRKAVTNALYTTTRSPAPTINPDVSGILEPEPDNIFDSELSLNQIIESLKDLEGTTMPFASNYMEFVDMTTLEPNSLPPYDKINSEAVTIVNNGQNLNSQQYFGDDSAEYKQPNLNSVSYIPQTTMEFLTYPATEAYNQKKNPFVGIEHKESDDNMILDEKTTAAVDVTTTDSSLSKQSTNSMDNLLRESFDSVLSQIKNEEYATTNDYENIETTTFADAKPTTMKTIDKKKNVVKPTPYIAVDVFESGHTEPMKYFETVIKQYEQEKNKNVTGNRGEEHSTTHESIEDVLAKTTTSSMDSEAVDITTENLSLESSSTEGSDAQTTAASSEGVFSKEPTTTGYFSTSDPNQDVTEELSTDSLRSDESTEKQLDITTEEAATTLFLRSSSEEKEIASVTIATESDESDYSTQITDGQTIAAVESDEDTTDSVLDETTVASDSDDANQTQYEMIQLIENIVKDINSDKPQNATNSIQRKEDSNELANKTIETVTMKREEMEFSDLGETTTTTTTIAPATEIVQNDTKPGTKTSAKLQLTKKIPTLAPILNNLKMKVVNALKNANTIELEPAPKQALGLEESTTDAGEDILEFTKFCNEVAFNFWTALNNDGISSARSLTVSPFALTSMLAMLFMGARGRTSGEINDMLHLDDIVTFNPHAVLRNISESVDDTKDDNVFNNVFVRELLSERSKGKILPFFKEKVNQFYSGYVEEVNFSAVNDIIRRRTNLLMKRYTGGKINEYLKGSNVWVKPPLSGISANLFETDCSKASKNERDGEMFFQVLPAIRQRRLIPIPSAVWKSGFTAGYDPELDATAVAIGLSKNIISTIFVMPGQQGHSAPGDNLERLESVLMVNAVSQNAWRRMLATLMERPGLEVQIPRFTHRSFVNTTNALRKLGLETLFDQNTADLRGITGSIARDMYVSDLIQINTFSTCGEDKLAEEHHVEMYPAPPNKHRNIDYTSTSSAAYVPIDYENERAFAADPIYDLKYLKLPLPLRPRQARIPEAPRLRFDKPFLYFVRHNPTGMVLYFGRFNPRLLP